jgi:hypothetical protein
VFSPGILRFRERFVYGVAEFGQLKGFSHDQIHASWELSHGIDFFSIRSDHEDGQSGMTRFEGNGENVTFHSWHEIIDDDEIEGSVFAKGQGIAAAGNGFDVALIKFEHPTDGI